MQKYVFKPYNSLFIDLFENEKNRIKNGIKEKIKIEHIGSTAVPGLAGKGIIDIVIACNRKDSNIVSKELQNIGYEFRPTASTPERLFHRMDLPDPLEQLRSYHVHLTYYNSIDWQETIRFRDYLKNHKEDREKYANLKKIAAESVNEDGKKYRKMKEPLIQEIIKKAFSKK